MLLIGLTGGIGSGKSTVTEMFRDLGVFVIDADEIAREVVLKGTQGWKKIIETFGESVLNEDGEIDRARMADVVFKDPEKLSMLNSIVHPLVFHRMGEEMEWAKSVIGSDGVFMIDAALIYEANMVPMFDKVIVIATDEEIQIDRLISSRNMNEEEARLRIMNQMPLEDKIEKADIVIWNNSTIEDLKRDVEKCYRKLTGMSEKK